VVNRAKQYGLLNGEQTRAFTVSDAEQFRRFIGNNIDPANRAQTAALKGLQGSVDESVNALAGNAGADAGQAFQAARSAASERFAALKPAPVKALAATDEAPVNFIETKVLGAKPGELAGLRKVVTQQDPAAWDGVRGSVLDWLQKKATMGDAEGKFSGKRFGDALDQIGNARLKELFSDAERAQLGTIKRASYAMTREPPYAGVNHSNTGSTVANLVNKQMLGPLAAGLAHVPVLGPAAVGAYSAGREALADAATASAARAAAKTSMRSLAPGPVASEDVRQRLARLLMMGGAGPLANQQFNAQGRASVFP
jgi:hypothetical protein